MSDAMSSFMFFSVVWFYLKKRPEVMSNDYSIGVYFQTRHIVRG
jgi:hypothetical protein